jgi:RsiW-degrading membrane proteinase PrsW (M82 family)
MEVSVFLLAFCAGLIPALFWLWFWLREDKEKPEPYFLIAIAFIAGMAVVPMALPLQQWAMSIYPNVNVMLMWVVIEELLKYAVALAVLLWNREVDEPIDYVIYMIIIALGFAALENALFLFNPLLLGEYVLMAQTGALRFVGATLLHVLASGTIGVCMAFAYYQSATIKLLAGTVGLCLAVLLHALFNFFIMESSGNTLLAVFLFVWLGIIMLFMLFEGIKQLERSHNNVA